MSDVEGLITVPPLGDGIKSAVVVMWNKKWRDRVSAGDVLVVLETVNGRTEIRSPISGYLARQSAPVGREVRAGNKLGDVEQNAPAIYRVQVRRVQPLGLPECIRFDYLTGFSLTASEWVCANAPGLIGERGCGWWVDRVGFVPQNVDEAYAQAVVLPVPEQIAVAYPWQDSRREGLGPPIITQIDYSAPTRTRRTSISGDNSIFLFEEDVRELERCKAELDTSASSSDTSIEKLPAPSWWPRIVPSMADVSPIDPPNRRSISDDTARTISRILMVSRSQMRSDRSPPFRQVVRNLCMAYTTSQAPIVQELRRFFPSIWPSKDIIVDNHFDTLSVHLEKETSGTWLSDVIDPLIDGASPVGMINSGLWWTGAGYSVDEVWIPCLDIEWVFWDSLRERSKELRKVNADPETISPSFLQALYRVLRDCINKARVDLGLPQIGEGWISETDLYYRVKRLFPNEGVIHHGRAPWLRRQHFDIWMPARNVAIEYQGEQHFIEIGLFGGADGLARTQGRDARKRNLCTANGVKLIEISFNDELSDEWIKEQISPTPPESIPRVIHRCPSCGANLRLPRGKSGTVRCPSCRELFHADT